MAVDASGEGCATHCFLVLVLFCLDTAEASGMPGLGGKGLLWVCKKHLSSTAAVKLEKAAEQLKSTPGRRGRRQMFPK